MIEKMVDSALSVPNFISDYVIFDDAFFLLVFPSRLSSPYFLLLSFVFSLMPTLCSLELLLPRSHYLSLLLTLPPSASLVLTPFFLKPCVCILYGSCENIQYVCACLPHMCLTLITLKNVTDYESIKYRMKTIFCSIFIFPYWFKQCLSVVKLVACMLCAHSYNFRTVFLIYSVRSQPACLCSLSILS